MVISHHLKKIQSMQFFLAKFYNIENVIKGMMMLASFYQEKPKSWRRLVYLKRFQVPTFERRSLKPEVTDVQHTNSILGPES